MAERKRLLALSCHLKASRNKDIPLRCSFGVSGHSYASQAAPGLQSRSTANKSSLLREPLQQFAMILTHAALLFGMPRSVIFIIFTSESFE